MYGVLYGTIDSLPCAWCLGRRREMESMEDACRADKEGPWELEEVSNIRSKIIGIQ